MPRLFDLVLAAVLGTLLTPLMLAVGLAVLLCDGRPLFYSAERMRAPGRAFTLWKFRTMRPAPGAAGVSGGHLAARVTPLGRRLRALRLDELPQLLNILRGDIGFVGPRPPLKQWVERFPEIYGEVLKVRPGVTGLASLRFHAVEARLMAAARDGREAEAIYARRCLPRKARLDLIHQRNRSMWFDLRLIGATAALVLRRGSREMRAGLPQGPALGAWIARPPPGRAVPPAALLEGG